MFDSLCCPPSFGVYASLHKKLPFLYCVSMVLGVKIYLREFPHPPDAGICFPKFSMPSCYRSFSQTPLPPVQLIRSSATHLTSEPCLRTLKTINRTLFAYLIIALFTKEDITRTLHSIDSKALSQTKSKTWKLSYVIYSETWSPFVRDCLS
jgi:hypothetical protein